MYADVVDVLVRIHTYNVDRTTRNGSQTAPPGATEIRQRH